MNLRRRDGGTGIRAAFRTLWAQALVGSNPTLGTKGFPHIIIINKSVRDPANGGDKSLPAHTSTRCACSAPVQRAETNIK